MSRFEWRLATFTMVHFPISSEVLEWSYRIPRPISERESIELISFISESRSGHNIPHLSIFMSQMQDRSHRTPCLENSVRFHSLLAKWPNNHCHALKQIRARFELAPSRRNLPTSCQTSMPFICMQSAGFGISRPQTIDPIKFAAAPFRLGPARMLVHVTFRIERGDIHDGSLSHLQ
jgi:hypothetical protein